MLIHNTIGDILFVANDSNTKSLVLDQYEKEFRVYFYNDKDASVTDVKKYSTLVNALRTYANRLEDHAKDGF